MTRYAAIDIGTVTCRMLVADVVCNSCESSVAGIQPDVIPLVKEYAITNLGEGVDATNRLKPEAMQRVFETVSRYVKIRDSFATDAEPTIQTMAVATSAARDAENSNVFVDELARLGITLDVIPGSKEAALSFMGASSGVVHMPAMQESPQPLEKIMVVDIGGGSTEISIGDAGAPPVCSHSFDIGCRRLTERYLKSDPPTEEELAHAKSAISKQFLPWFSQNVGASRVRMVAVAGTATSAVSIRESMEVYDSAAVDGSIVTRADIDEITRMLASVPLAERREVVGLDPGRAPVIVAGMLILGEVMDAAGINQFLVSESDILEGMVLSMAQC